MHNLKISALLYAFRLFICSSYNEDDLVLTREEDNTLLMNRYLEDNPIQFVKINEYLRDSSVWKLAADSQESFESLNRFSTEETYFVLDGTDRKHYPTVTLLSISFSAFHPYALL